MNFAGSRGSDAFFLHPTVDTKYGFMPVARSAAVNEVGHYNANTYLLELGILSESGDCPHPALRQPDSHFHISDLLSEVTRGGYLLLGRDND